MKCTQYILITLGALILCQPTHAKVFTPVPAEIEKAITELTNDQLAISFLDSSQVREMRLPAISEPWDSWISPTPKTSIDNGLYHASAFQILKGSTKSHNVLTADSWANLELFHKNNTILKKLRAYTYLGQSALAHLITQPLTDVYKLTQRQDALKEIASKNNVRRELATALKAINAQEPLFYRYRIYQQHMQEKAGYFTSPLANEFFVRLWQATAIALPIASIKLITNMIREDHIYGPQNARQLPVLALYGGFSSLIIAAVQMAGYKQEQQFLICLADIMQQAEKISELLAKSPQLKNGIPGAQVIIKFFNGKDRALLDLLKSDTFKGNPSIFSRVGNIKAARNLYYQSASEIKALLQAIGMVDACVSMAALVQNYASENPYCFVELLDQPTPQLTLINAWLPSAENQETIQQSIVVPPGQNLLITGPARSGKTSTVQIIEIATLLAQTFGIAPAEQASMTPFQILAYPTPQTNNASTIFTRLHTLQPDSKALVIIDCWIPGNTLTTIAQGLIKRHPLAMTIMTSSNPDMQSFIQSTRGTYSTYALKQLTDHDGIPSWQYKLHAGV
jgi:hypothetical protein